MKAPINRIIDFSVVDGPGNRTSIFFQGCNFNCWYCHNPETIHLCNNCGDCINVCPVNALKMESGKVVYIPKLCQQCDRCIKQCKQDASPRIMWMTPEEVEKRILNNVPFIRGVTCSGGECTLYPEFIKELFTRLQLKKLSCLLDSNGSVIDFSKESALLEVTDGVMLDMKAMDDTVHEQLTGNKKDLMKQNAVYLASVGKLIEVRTVITKEGLDAENTIIEVAKLLKPYLHKQNIRYRIIQFRPFGVRESFLKLGTPDIEEMKKLELIAKEHGFSDVLLT